MSSDKPSGANNNGAAASEAMKEENKSTGGNVDPRLSAASTKFGLKLYSEIGKQSAGKNVFISPASVALALAMTYNGAGGETGQAMARGLELSGMSLEEANRAYAELHKSLQSLDPKVQIEIANSLWGRKEMKFRPDFLDRAKEFYGAEVTSLDFNDPGAPAAINDWVSRKTHGKIGKIVDQIGQDSILFLINAIYFKGKWTDEFEKAETTDQDFTLAGGKVKKHPMMSRTGRYPYFKGENFQAVSIPYGNKRVSMYVFLPEKGASLDEFVKGMDGAAWDGWMSRFRETKGDIVLPRFKLEYEITLNDALASLGMGVAFDPDRADFSGMLQEGRRAFISSVKHKSFVEVNEEGTEAAAATSVEVQTTSARIERDTFRMVVDHPFFFAIRDNQTGMILFMGSINDPS
jgi:serpin B